LKEEFEDSLAFGEGEEGGREAGGLGRGVGPDGIDADEDDGGEMLECFDISVGVGGELGDGVREEGEDTLESLEGGGGGRGGGVEGVRGFFEHRFG